MEVFILDSLYRRQSVIDRYESLIWTERFSSVGDFQLVIASTLENRNRLKTGVRLGIQESYRVMTIETVEDSTNDNGERVLEIKGTSLEAILDCRVARSSTADLTTTPKWVITDTPVNIAKKIFHDVCVTGVVDAADVIPLINETSIFPADTLPSPTDVVTYEIEPKTVYEAIVGICELYLMGFRLIRNFDTGQLYFNVYMGSDRTTHQTTLPAVVFSPGMNNLENTSELFSTAAYKNVAYVMSPVGFQIVYASGADSSTAGFDRRVLVVKADDITDPTPSVATAQMIQRGMEELAKCRRYQGFDGEVSQYSQYKYGIDYNLGDLVETRGSEGNGNVMKVTEHIYVSDENGVRSYPTLSVLDFVTPGSWLSVPINKVWTDYDSTQFWANQP